MKKSSKVLDLVWIAGCWNSLLTRKINVSAAFFEHGSAEKIAV
jgi:hypothetical protein